MSESDVPAPTLRMNSKRNSMDDSQMDTRQRTKNSAHSAGHEHEPIVVSGEEARQGKIVLNTPARRRRFVGILVFCIVLLVVIGFVV